MQLEYLTCDECGWQGEGDELVSKTAAPDDRAFICCPDCMGTAFETDTEEVPE